MSLSTGSATLWAVTHLLAILNLVFGLMLYIAPDYFTMPPTGDGGILKTSHDDGHLDPVTVFFFRGEGSIKLSLSLFTLVVSKVVVSSGNATSQDATEFCAALFLALLVPAIPVWGLNTDPSKADIFDAIKYKESMTMASVLCMLLVIGLFQSSSWKTRRHEKAKLTRIQKACAFFIANGAFFALPLLWDPEASFAPGGIQPVFTSTDYKNNLFDPVMMYAGRMFGTAHCVFLIALWYLPMEPVLVSTLVLTIMAPLFPLDIFSVFNDTMNLPMMLFCTVLHTTCTIVNYKSVTASVIKMTSSEKKKE